MACKPLIISVVQIETAEVGPDKPSIVVLCFAKMSGDSEQEYWILPRERSRDHHRTFAQPVALTCAPVRHDWQLLLWRAQRVFFLLYQREGAIGRARTRREPVVHPITAQPA